MVMLSGVLILAAMKTVLKHSAPGHQRRTHAHLKRRGNESAYWQMPLSHLNRVSIESARNEKKKVEITNKKMASVEFSMTESMYVRKM
jgi:hypothetical protein